MTTNERQLRKLLKESAIKSGIGDYAIAVGGNGFNGSDLDLIMVGKSLKFRRLREFTALMEKAAGKKISISPMTELQARHTSLWSSKTAGMVYKGLIWVNRKFELAISWNELVKIRKRDSVYELTYWQKVLSKEDKSEKALEILMQEIMFLQGGGRENDSDSQAGS